MVLLPTGVPVSILRIITQRSEAEVELQRICDRTQDEAILHKESTVREVLQSRFLRCPAPTSLAESRRASVW